MKSVRAKLLVLNIFIVAATLAAMGFALRARIETNLLNEIDNSLVADTSSIIVSRVEEPAQAVVEPGKRVLQRKLVSPQNSEGKIVEVLRNNNSQVKMEASARLPRLIPVGAEGAIGPLALDPSGLSAAQKRGKNFHNFSLDGKLTRSLSVPLYESGRLVAVAQAVAPLASMQRQMADLDRGLKTLIPFAVLVSGLLGWALVGVTIRPLRRLLDSAKTLEPDLSSTRLPVIGNDEFAQLAGTFNVAFDRTANAFQQQREAIAQLERFTADAGHELRTPVAAIKGGTSFLLHIADLPETCKKTAQVMDRSADRMAKLIDDLLLLSRQDAGQELTMSPDIHLATIIAEAREELLEPECINVRIDVPENILLLTDPDALKRVFLNVLSNAFTYARSQVKVSAQVEDRTIVVKVQDDGEGIAPEHLARLGERFYRADSARSRERGGTGLGLAISKSLCLSLGGNLEIESTVGVGTTAFLSFPTRCCS